MISKYKVDYVHFCNETIINSILSFYLSFKVFLYIFLLVSFSNIVYERSVEEERVSILISVSNGGFIDMKNSPILQHLLFMSCSVFPKIIFSLDKVYFILSVPHIIKMVLNITECVFEQIT